MAAKSPGRKKNFAGLSSNGKQGTLGSNVQEESDTMNYGNTAMMMGGTA